MHDLFDSQLSPYRRRGLLLDSNLLVLYAIGWVDTNLIRSFKRTASFSVADFVLLHALVEWFGALVTTPHVLTEVNGLLNALTEDDKPRVRGWMTLNVPLWTETPVPATVLTTTPAFLHLGLTDAALARLAQDGPLVMSTDGALVRWIDAADGAAQDFGVWRYLSAQR